MNWVNETVEHQLVKQLRRIERRRDRVVTRAVMQTGLYGGQHMLLMDVYFHPGISQRELAEHMGVSSAAVAINLKKLEKAGFIRRVMDEGDNRYNCVYPTEAGEALCLQSIRIFDELDAEMLQEFTREEKDRFLGFLNRLYQKLGKMEEEQRRKSE